MRTKSEASERSALQPLAYSVNDFCRAVSIGRTLAYALIAKGELRTVRIAGRRLIPATEAKRLLEQHAA